VFLTHFRFPKNENISYNKRGQKAAIETRWKRSGDLLEEDRGDPKAEYQTSHLKRKNRKGSRSLKRGKMRIALINKIYRIRKRDDSYFERKGSRR